MALTMSRLCRPILLAMVAPLLFTGGPAAAQCLLCTAEANARADADAPTHPLQIDIIQPLNFDRLTVSSGQGGGSISIDPVNGARALAGKVVDLGGMPMSGRVRLRGEPGRGVRVELPRMVMMTASSGVTVPLDNIGTSLPSAPRLGADGTLEFNFGGQLKISGNASGDYRGRIPIDAFYE